MPSSLVLRDISLQISEAQQEGRLSASPVLILTAALYHKSLNRTESAFVAQFSASKGLNKTLENLFLTSNSLRQKCEKIQSTLKDSVPRAIGALEKLDVSSSSS
ncbi:hypothetical protein NADFUDRAFT_43612 [Nadsonia fulvescens var. elongata DSM 6958]|uniref:Uncharacterized protein n=1 Tax=Nadsonia fulvescens var. elongata DSM 6958 TaxID=857566 RepID=A0A1E3PEY0_9ASCO|nr:hypothetical protein NADFUDRAFT_43612 [Nadsonia fulvescens var. elongata DSM 6958]